MGIAISGMHYTGMAATEFAPGSVCLSSPLGVDPAWLAGMVGGGSFLLLTMTLMASVLDTRLGDQNARMAAELRHANVELHARAEALAEQMTSGLRESEARVRAVVDSALDCIVAMDAQGRVLDFNPAAERTFGFSRADMIGALLADKIIPPAYREAHAKGMERYLHSGQTNVLGRRIEIVALRADGSEFPVELAVTVTSIGGEPVFTAHLRDLTARRMAEESLRLRGLALESSVNGVLIVNHRHPDCPVEYANPATRRITGYTADEIIGRNFLSLLRSDGGGEGAGAALAAVRDGLATRSEVRVLLRNYRKDGSLFWNDLYIAPVRDDAGLVTHSVMIVHDVSPPWPRRRSSHRQANYDALTGLANRCCSRTASSRRIADALLDRRPVAVVFLDLDHFKFINDSLGHTRRRRLLQARRGSARIVRARATTPSRASAATSS